MSSRFDAVTSLEAESFSDNPKFRKWANFGDYHVYPWSIAGEESCVVLRGNGGLKIAFDLGYACNESLSCDSIFISHGHMDHVSAIPQHASKRSLLMKDKGPSTYYVPQHLLEPLTEICQKYETVSEQNVPVVLKAIKAGERIQISNGYFAVPFPTVHRVTSFGYIIFKRRKHLKPEYEGKESKEIQQLLSDGQVISDVFETPEVAYTGDTTFDSFLSPSNPNLLRVKLLITESTYLRREEKGKDVVNEAKNKGHCHVAEFMDNISIFENVNTVLLTHISNKYSFSEKCALLKNEQEKSSKDSAKKFYAAILDDGSPTIF